MTDLLLEGVPGLAKTTVVNALAKALDASFARILETCCRPTFSGSTTGSFTTFRWRALLEAMQERQVTIGDDTFPLPRPFLVLATQNPLEQEGTYPLPEAQTDRFLMKLLVDYPDAAEERVILDRALERERPTIGRCCRWRSWRPPRRAPRRVYIDDRLKDYCVALVARRATPGTPASTLKGLIEVGASPER